jgi:hypothetical protein
MGIKFSDEQSSLYKAIDEILWNDWDPIGVKKFGDWPKDEYQSYVPLIFNLKINNADAKVIAQALYEIENDRIGVKGSYEGSLIVAEKIINL